MIYRSMAAASLAGLVALAGYELYVDAQQAAKIDRFMSRGPRFTAKDGQELCARVRTLEAASYGYRDSGHTPLTCDYLEHK